MAFNSSGYLKFSTSVIISCILLTACGGEDSYTEGNSATLSDQDARQAFIDTRGTPEMFTIMFVDEDSDGGEKRRVETWIYDGEITKTVVFDNGYFLKENVDANTTTDFNDSKIDPVAFSEYLTPTQVVSNYGNPDREEFDRLGTTEFESIHYDGNNTEPPKSFVFVNSSISFISVGYSFDYYEGSEELVVTPIN